MLYNVSFILILRDPKLVKKMAARKDMRDRVMRINVLYKYALERLKEGYTEDAVYDELVEIARRNWSPSYNTLKDYVENAISKAKADFEETQKRVLARDQGAKQ